jgi:hypothetical protein
MINWVATGRGHRRLGKRWSFLVVAEAMIRKALAGVREMDQEKLTPLLRQTYHDSIPDAVNDLGQPEETRAAFAGFQKYLYLPAA